MFAYMIVNARIATRFRCERILMQKRAGKIQMKFSQKNDHLPQDELAEDQLPMDKRKKL